ncbi:hypothetical protein MTR_0155s0050 [Medicago truncatula]|uniref:Uncharacterized protein n=1 Tax=Medicago truncatula TaxID=3880 RepID=A0A072TGP0_MEDTR|nr:hypothetical protein MTR_0155s0050 [Medicago truncatula]
MPRVLFGIGTCDNPTERMDLGSICCQRQVRDTEHSGGFTGSFVESSAIPARAERRHQQQAPKMQFDPIPMTYAELLPILLQENLIKTRAPPRVPDTLPAWYQSNLSCAFHQGAPGHDIEHCFSLKTEWVAVDVHSTTFCSNNVCLLFFAFQKKSFRPTRDESELVYGFLL